MAYKFSESKPSCGCKVWKERKKKIINNRKIAYMEDNTLFALLHQQISTPVVKMSHLLSAGLPRWLIFWQFLFAIVTGKNAGISRFTDWQRKLFKLVQKPRRLWLKTLFLNNRGELFPFLLFISKYSVLWLAYNAFLRRYPPIRLVLYLGNIFSSLWSSSCKSNLSPVSM